MAAATSSQESGLHLGAEAAILAFPALQLPWVRAHSGPWQKPVFCCGTNVHGIPSSTLPAWKRHFS